jgi:hypothetical protein
LAKTTEDITSGTVVAFGQVKGISQGGIYNGTKKKAVAKKVISTPDASA